jgi:VanZ family protein
MKFAKVSRWLLVAAWCALIFVASAQSQLPGPQAFLLDALFKKAGHYGAYGVLMALVLYALRARAPLTRKQVLIGLAFCGAYAITDEFHQTFVPNRTGQAIDVFIDLAGAVGGAAVFAALTGAGWSRMRYWLIWSFALWLILLLNLPWRGLPPQDSSVLFRDPVLIWGFSHFGALIVPLLALWLMDGTRRRHTAQWLAAPFMAVGVLAYAPWLALRPHADAPAPAALPRWLDVSRTPRWFWALWLALTALNFAWLSGANLTAFIIAQWRFLGIAFMWFDILICQLLALPLLDAALRRAGSRTRGLWLIAAALLGPFALSAYLLLRPRDRALEQKD